MSGLGISYVGGPTSLIEIGGVRLLTDPTFDEPGAYPMGPRALTKTVGPAIRQDAVGPLDAVLLSHDQHPDNLDAAGRRFVEEAVLVLSTRSARERLTGEVHVLPNWEHTELRRPDGGVLRVTGVPAQHGPAGSEAVVGEVTGFVLSGEEVPTVYVSGDNASLDVVREIARRCGPIDVALLFAGAARTDLVPEGPLTLTSEEAVQAAVILDARAVVPLHFEHWGHFTEDGDSLEAAFAAAGLSKRLHRLKPGEFISL